MSRAYYAGQDVDAPCGRCGGETRHQVLTVTDGLPEQLICGACRSVHKFRAPRPAPQPRAPRTPAAPRAGLPRAAGTANQLQQALDRETTPPAVRPYRVTEVWVEGAWMDHPAFGLGRVQRKAGKKVDVLFRDGLRTLVSA